MPFFRVFTPFLALALIVPPAAAQTALPQIGAPRVLVLLDENGQTLEGEPFNVAFEPNESGFYFTLDRGRERNIWRARPEKLTDARFPVWRARPVTFLRAPLFALGAAPHPDGSLFCLSNAGSGDGLARVCRLDWNNLAPQPMVVEGAPHADVAVSPTGQILSFTRVENQSNAVWGAFSRGERAAFPLASPARGAAWLDGQTLVFESLGTPRGLVSRKLSEPRAQFLLTNSGEVSALGGGVGIVFSSRPNSTSPSELYLLGRDGSGLRALNMIQGARRPVLSPDGKFLAFDAPFEGERRLWLAPVEGGVPLVKTRRTLVTSPKLERQSVLFSNASVAAPFTSPEVTPPIPTPSRGVPVGFIQAVETRKSTQVSSVVGERALRSLVIRGTTSGETPLSVSLDWGVGESPTIWNALAVSQNPTNNGPLALWTPSPGAQGIYTLRLNVNARGGAAQNLFRVRLPLGSQTGPSQIIGREPLPPLPLPPPAPTPQPIPTPQPNRTPRPVPTATPTPIPRPTVAPRPIPTPRPIPIPNPTPDSPPPSFVAKFNVSGTLARVAPGQKFAVTFWGQNLGTATWRSDQNAQNPSDSTRIVARWVDFSTGTRRKWNFFWLRGQVAPGGRLRQDLELSAPTRPGKYKLIYGLVRVPKDGTWSAPPYNAPQEAWPGEFGAIAFAVEVATVTVGEGEEN